MTACVSHPAIQRLQKMKIKKVFLTASLLFFCFVCKAQIIDNFDGTSIDTSLWEVSLPFGSSQVSQANGAVTLISRGGLNTVASFAGSEDIQGRFQFSGNNDSFRIVFRSDLSFNSPTMEKSGMIVVFDQNGGVQIGESEISSLAIGTFDPSGWIDFRIADDGNAVNLYVNDASTPLLTASSSYRTGDRIGFYNREISGTAVDIDSLQIAVTPVPEPSALLGGAVMAVMGLWTVKFLRDEKRD